MENNPFNSRRLVLVFNPNQILMGVVGSLHMVTDLTSGNTQSILFACIGRYGHSQGLYYRPLNDNVFLKFTDLGSLKLKEYDRMCGEENRKYYPKKEMKETRRLALKRTHSRWEVRDE